ncbi:MAG TPA: hypothetical protein VM537_14450 [Anaerolineae bacterium]|nr:hypothetical protein [Anaerolineae bacterium]
MTDTEDEREIKRADKALADLADAFGTTNQADLCNEVRKVSAQNEILRREGKLLRGKVRDFLDFMYPADVFDGSSGDPGPVRIVALRAAIEDNSEWL